jgi:hypothetical protein
MTTASRWRPSSASGARGAGDATAFKDGPKGLTIVSAPGGELSIWTARTDPAGPGPPY